jgi:hypothetical protein
MQILRYVRVIRNVPDTAQPVGIAGALTEFGASVQGPETPFVVNVPFIERLSEFCPVSPIVSCTIFVVNPLNTPLTVKTPACVVVEMELKHVLSPVVRLNLEPVMGDVLLGLATCWFSVVVNTYAAALLESRSVTDQFPVTLVGVAVDELVPHAARASRQANTATIEDLLMMTDK